MSPTHALLRRLAAAVVVTSAVALFPGCSASAKSGTNAGATAGASDSVTTSSETASSRAELASDKGGAQLWAENCSRCHNVRPPDYYSPGQWALVMQHMRVRAYLTGQEERQITAFLQSQ